MVLFKQLNSFNEAAVEIEVLNPKQVYGCLENHGITLVSDEHTLYFLAIQELFKRCSLLMKMVLKLLTYHCYLSPPRIIVFSDNPVACCGSNYNIASREL